MRVTGQIKLAAARLVVELHQDGELLFLDVRSVLDPRQAFLLPLPAPPAIDGLGLFTRLGRLHALPWGLAYGAGTLPAGAVVSFSSDTLRFRRSATASPVQLGELAWAAVAEGDFRTAATVVNGVETARVVLADRW
jgi:hypothetical protein